MTTQNSSKVAKIENTFIANAQYKMTAKEQKVFYYLVSHLDPKNEKEFYTITVPIKEIEEMLRDNDDRYGSFHEKMEKLCDSLLAKSIKFPSTILLEGKQIRGGMNFFSLIRPTIDNNGETVIEFVFSPYMSPFLLQLHHYVNIGVQEIVPMSNTHAIRMYTIFKSEKDRLKGVKNAITMKYFLAELKAILGIDEKYTSTHFANFKINVLDKIKDDINENAPTMTIDYNYLKTQRKITGVTFTVYEKKATAGSLEQPKKEPKEKKQHSKDYTPSVQELAVLSRSKKKAFEKLIELGVFEGIAYKQIIPTIKGSEFEGYEDIFIEKAILHFEKTAIQTTTKALKASTFVTWWTKNKIFESGEVWADILEKVVNHKKHLQKTNVTAFENRIIAKAMTNTQFEEYIKKNQK